MTNIRVYPHIDKYGYYWINSATFVAVPQPCFVCGKPTPYVEINFEAHFCDSVECNKKITADLAAAAARDNETNP